MPIVFPETDKKIDAFVNEIVKTEREIRGLEWLGQVPEVPKWHARAVSYAEQMVAIANGNWNYAFSAAVNSISRVPKAQEGELPPNFIMRNVAEFALLVAIGNLCGDVLKGAQFYDPVFAEEGQRRGWRPSDGYLKLGRFLGRR